MRTRSIGDFLDEVASAKATSGGGSVAAVCGAMASALGLRVCHDIVDEGQGGELEDLLTSFGLLQEAFLNLANVDEEAVSELKVAYALDQADNRRSLMLASARREVTKVARRVAEKGNELLEHLYLLLALGFKQSIGNMGAAIYLAQAAVKSSMMNARTNLSYIQDVSEIDDVKRELRSIESSFSELSNQAVTSLVGLSNG